jgi:hypothetical protein
MGEAAHSPPDRCPEGSNSIPAPPQQNVYTQSSARFVEPLKPVPEITLGVPPKFPKYEYCGLRQAKSWQEPFLANCGAPESLRSVILGTTLGSFTANVSIFH